MKMWKKLFAVEFRWELSTSTIIKYLLDYENSGINNHMQLQQSKHLIHTNTDMFICFHALLQKQIVETQQ